MIIWDKIRILGIGSYSIVFLACVAATNARLIAIKSSRSPFTANSLRKEAHILNHFIGYKEIIQVIEGQITVDRNSNLIHNLLIEYAPHGSLLDLIKKNPLSENQARIYTLMILKAISKIHRRGVVHCNLKPSNILLFPNEVNNNYFHVKIGDFGLSKIIGEEKVNVDSNTIEPRATTEYMSPEYVILGEIDRALDIWSIGRIVVEMMTGLSDANKMSIMFRSGLGIIKKVVFPKILDGVSSECDDFLNKCLVLKASERWSADMLLQHPFICNTQGLSNDFSSFFSYQL